MATCIFRVGDSQAAEDITSQVFERALRRLASVRDPARLRAWLFTIARNAITDYRRAKRATAGLEVADEFQHLWVEPPETEAERREERRRLLRHLRTLGERETRGNGSEVRRGAH
jgi:RNA polymerase sigma factor (sigma-70 family)